MADTPEAFIDLLYSALKPLQPAVAGIVDVYDYEPGPAEALGGNYQTIWYAGTTATSWQFELRTYIALTPGPREAQQTLREVLAATEDLIPDEFILDRTDTDWWAEGRKLVGMVTLSAPRGFG